MKRVSLNNVRLPAIALTKNGQECIIFEWMTRNGGDAAQLYRGIIKQNLNLRVEVVYRPDGRPVDGPDIYSLVALEGWAGKDEGPTCDVEAAALELGILGTQDATRALKRSLRALARSCEEAEKRRVRSADGRDRDGD